MIQLRRPEGGGGAARFAPGDLVCHRRYGYRGVVVEVDLQCTAGEQWYSSNNTQPDRDQPWYHVLVDGSPATTYAAQENLAPDQSAAPVVHPLLDQLFSAFSGGHYVRNERPFGPPPPA